MAGPGWQEQQAGAEFLGEAFEGGSGTVRMPCLSHCRALPLHTVSLTGSLYSGMVGKLEDASVEQRVTKPTLVYLLLYEGEGGLDFSWG